MAKETEELSGYNLSRQIFDFAFENTEAVKPIHIAIYFFAIEHCNRLGWKKKFGLPSSMVMEAIGVKSYNTYIGAFNELVEWNFITLIEKSKNQYSSNVIALSKNDNAQYKALDKALTKHSIKHTLKQGESTVQSTSESIDSINKQDNNITLEQLNNKQGSSVPPQQLPVKKVKAVRYEFKAPTEKEVIEFVKSKGFPEWWGKKIFDNYDLAEPPWTDRNGKQVQQWKKKINNNWLQPKHKTEIENEQLTINNPARRTGISSADHKRRELDAMAAYAGAILRQPPG